MKRLSFTMSFGRCYKEVTLFVKSLYCVDSKVVSLKFVHVCGGEREAPLGDKFCGTSASYPSSDRREAFE